jgi:hypothetical protein
MQLPNVILIKMHSDFWHSIKKLDIILYSEYSYQIE